MSANAAAIRVDGYSRRVSALHFYGLSSTFRLREFCTPLPNPSLPFAAITLNRMCRPRSRLEASVNQNAVPSFCTDPTDLRLQR